MGKLSSDLLRFFAIFNKETNSISSAKRQAEDEEIMQPVLEEAKELARGAEILPDGIPGLAGKIQAVRQEGRQLRVKLGIDPTSTDLHIGHAVVFQRLKMFQQFGHQVVLIIGGFTAQIGDPSGRNTTRPPLTAAAVEDNARTYIEQIKLILDMNKVEVVNNASWLSTMTMVDILKLASKVTVNQLLAKEAFGERLEKQLPVGFHELFYPLLQGYDSVAVRADVEVGGTDQRFNLLQGRELQVYYGQTPQVALLLPLLEGTDGVQKMSKSYNNYIGLKENPADVFGKCMRIPDHLIIKYFELATTMTSEQINRIKDQLSKGSNPKEVKEMLGFQIVEQYHGKAAAEKARVEWQKVHSDRLIPEDMPDYTVAKGDLLFKVLAESEMAAGTAAAKRLIAEGAVRLDGEPIKDPQYRLMASGTSILQIGRRKFLRLVPDAQLKCS